MPHPARAAASCKGRLMCVSYSPRPSAKVGRMSLEQSIATAWTDADDDHPEATLAFFRQLLSQAPDDPVRGFELASAYDWMGREAEAIPHYEAAIGGGLSGDRERRARIQLGSSLRNVGRPDDAVSTLEQVTRDHPDSAFAECLLALSLADAGRPREAVARLIDLVARTAVDDDADVYRAALQRYAKTL